MEPIIKVDNVSMCFNLSKEKHESLKEYFLAMVQGRLQYDLAFAGGVPVVPFSSVTGQGINGIKNYIEKSVM